MTLKIFLTKQSESSFSEQLDFNKLPIFLGRDDKNDVILPDSFKAISRKHAKIIETEGILQLVDLESQNFTYLNGQKIEPNEENTLQSGDKIKIGEYELEVLLIKEKDIIPEDDQKTMVFYSPFAEEITNIVENLKSISEKYSLDSSHRKSDLLKLSIFQSFNSLEKNDVNKAVAEFFAYNFLEKEYKSKDNSIKNVGVRGNIEIPELKKDVSSIKNFKTETVSSLSEYSFSSHFTLTLDILLDAFSKLIQGFLHFRQEFFGVTIYHTIPIGSLNELKEYLFNPAISSDEEKKRLSLIKEETQKLLTHQIGLLEGYRISVTEGSKSLLQSLDPVIIEKEMQAQNQRAQGLDLGRILPFTQKAKLLDMIKENYQKYISDPYHIEKKFFRPLFLKGYQKRILSNKDQSEY